MARSKRNSKRSSKPIPQKSKDYKMLTLEEVRSRESKYAKMLVDLRACLQLVDAAYTKVEKLKLAGNAREIWNTYLRCDGLPKPYVPPEIRLFFVKLRFFETENIEKTIDWLLSVDERSILSQDIFRKDLTRKTLVNEIRPNFGVEYEKNVSLALKVLKDLEYYLENGDLTKKASHRILKDINEQKKAVHQEIIEFFDRFTYRIISSEDSYMSSVDAITSEYFYECEDFRIHIWTLKNVPVLFEFLEETNMSVNLHNLNIRLKIPHSLLEDNLTLRGVHFEFDHFSEHAKSFFQEINVPTEHLTSGISDLHECLMHEWSMQVEIQTEVRNKMLQKRLEYDEKIKAMEADLEKQKKEKKNLEENDRNKKKRTPKSPKEPPVITADTYPDIWDDFLEKEHKQFEDFINIVYHPNVLNLTDVEINLKKYSVLGGIYQMYFVKKPTHFNFNDFNMTWHEDNGDLVTLEKHAKEHSSHHDIFHSFHRIRMTTLSRGSALSVREREFTPPNAEYDESPLFVVTFELPKFLCRWGEPLPCHYETDIVGFIENPIEKPPGQLTQPQTPVTALTTDDVAETQFEGFSINPILRPEISLTSQRSSRLFRPSLLSVNKQNIDDTPIIIDDFDLDIPLMKYQIRYLQRHCLPRIISSLKFPIEIKDEEEEKNSNKPKGAGGTLVRKRVSIDDVVEPKTNERVFSYDHQNNPERIFPYFPVPEEFSLPFQLNDYTDIIKELEPKTFSDLILLLDHIKKSYLDEHEHTAKAPPLKLNPDLLKALFTRQKQQPVIEEKIPEKKYVVEKRKNKLRKPALVVTAVSRKTERGKSVGQHSMAEEEDRKKKSVGQHSLDEEQELQEDKEYPEPEEEEEEEDTRERFTFSHWTKEHIRKHEYDKENCKVTIWTDRLGIMGFAFKRYEHFPFRFWSVEPSEENPETEVIFTLETQYVKCVIFVTAAGFRGYVTEPTKKFVRHREMYLVIEEPITDFKELKKRFREKFLNIFSEHDARFYIENGYFSEKHLATEMHTYNCIAIHSLTMKFASSQWNRLAKRRDIVLNFAHCKEPAENMVQARITPEEATFVEILELCSNDLNVFNLQYTLTWRNIENYVDLHHLVVSVYPAAIDLRVKDPKLICNLKNFLSEVRPLSYC